MNVRLDAFTKVKAAIDKMVTELEEQQSDEVKHRDFCTSGLAQTEKEQQCPQLPQLVQRVNCAFIGEFESC